ncbi:putative methyltransferase NSUN7 [Trichomycterus rosablanca]|uniref:putative methyltransferase NSUN7 n=1 Tax=Trichomycterus rosablanca TaxID=2290929 RepID=UPI002F35C010
MSSLKTSSVCTSSPPSHPLRTISVEVRFRPARSDTPGVPTVPQGFPDRVYVLAADIFQEAQEEKTSDRSHARHSHIDSGKVSGTDLGQRQIELLAYELTFNTLKFQELLEEMLTDSCFHSSQQTPDDLMPLVLVMLYDLQDRKFQPREAGTEGGVCVGDVREVEESLHRFRTKLAASLARYRIKQDLVCVEDVLPPSVKEKHQRKPKLPVCAWVNTLKTSVEEACMKLKVEGFVQVDSLVHLDGRVFCKDSHCPDVLLFPHHARKHLERTAVFMDHTLIIQEKSRCLAACALRPFLAPNTDVLIVGFFSAHTVAHVAVQASVHSSSVHVCGLSDDHWEELQSTLSCIGCKNVHRLSEEFSDLTESDQRIQKVQVILLLPRCTTTGLSDPTTHIVDEDGDRDLLVSLSQGTTSHTKLKSLVRQQRRDLGRALTFPRVKTVVYCTCSVYPEENEQLIRKVLRNAAVNPKARPFRIVPTGWSDETEKFFRLQESKTTDGCFLCVLKREESADTVQDILVRAAAKGLLAGLTVPEKPKQVKSKETRRKKTRAAPPVLRPLTTPGPASPPNPHSAPDSPSEPLSPDTDDPRYTLDSRDPDQPSAHPNHDRPPQDDGPHKGASEATNRPAKGEPKARKRSRRVKVKRKGATLRSNTHGSKSSANKVSSSKAV